MRNLYTNILFTALAVSLQNSGSAQCGTPLNGGTASNMFTLIRNGNNPIAANKALNTVVFIHRNDAGTFGGNSGHLRYDISTNAGTTWTSNVGVLNPLSAYYGRYPNLAIYNPPLNTNPANAYVSYMAPIIYSTTVANPWAGIVTGVSQLNNTGITETYNQNGIGTPTWIPHSLVNGAPGVFWACEPVVPAGYTGYLLYKGVWSSTISDIVWNINYTVTPPFSTAWSTFPTVGDYNIAFDPTGNIGYFCFLGHVTPGSTNYALNPVLYKTTNGGNTWTGPIQVDMSKFSCISSNTTSPNVPSTNTEHDLVVDIYGNPHIITTVGNASTYAFNYNLWHHMYDITLKNGVWVAYDLGNVNGAPNTLGTGADIATQWQAPQAGRTADGSKVFFTWSDNSGYTIGQLNATPDLFTKAFDVVQNKWTLTKDLTSCNIATAGKILFPHLAPEMLEPAANVFKMPIMYGENSVAGQVIQTANFKFLDNAIYSATEFSVTPPAATITIPEGPNLLLCQNSSVTINVSAVGASVGEAVWSTGVNATSLSISSATPSTYSVAAQAGCNVGTATITVANLTLNAGAASGAVCPGNPATFTVLGNALGYTWTPGNLTGTNVTLNPTTSPVTITALGGGSCTMVQTVSVGLLPAPSVIIQGPGTICDGHTTLYTASGATGYSWSNGPTTSTIAVAPSQNTVYTVIGTAANSCTNVSSFTVVVDPSPTIIAVAAQPSVCAGHSVTLNALGSSSFTWEPVQAFTPSIAVSPTATTIYSVTGIGLNLCTTTKTIEMIVSPLPSLTVTSSKPNMCVGEKAVLTASGAATYTWTNPPSSSTTLQITPATTTTYTLIGKSIAGCFNTYTFSQVVLPCVGLADYANSGTLLVYPNPNNGTFNIKCETSMAIAIISETGQLVKEYRLNRENPEVAVSDLASGIYFLMGTGESGTVRFKLVVQK